MNFSDFIVRSSKSKDLISAEDQIVVIAKEIGAALEVGPGNYFVVHDFQNIR